MGLSVTLTSPLSAPSAIGELLNVLEALGLIKFDADERDEGVRMVKSMGKAWADSAQHGPDYLTRAIIEDVEKMGLKIVRA